MQVLCAVIFMLGVFANACIAQQGPNGILEFYRARLAKLHDLRVSVHKVICSNGVVADEDDYDWLWSPLGQSVRVHQTGPSRSYNAGMGQVDRFVAITHRQGNLRYSSWTQRTPKTRADPTYASHRFIGTFNTAHAHEQKKEG